MKPRILFVDDHEDTRAMISSLLGGQGYSVTTTESVSEGLRLARTRAFDLFLLDYRFSDGDGRELCERIREFDPRTPILFFAGTHPRVQEEALACGAQGFALKPDFDRLYALIGATVGAGNAAH